MTQNMLHLEQTALAYHEQKEDIPFIKKTGRYTVFQAPGLDAVRNSAEKYFDL